MWNINFSTQKEIVNNETLKLKIFTKLTDTCINSRVQVNRYVFILI